MLAGGDPVPGETPPALQAALAASLLHVGAEHAASEDLQGLAEPAGGYRLHKARGPPLRTANRGLSVIVRANDASRRALSARYKTPMQCWRATVLRTVRYATDHTLSPLSSSFPYIFTATPADWRGRPAFNLLRCLITFTAEYLTADCGPLIPGRFIPDDLAHTPEPSRAANGGSSPMLPCHWCPTPRPPARTVLEGFLVASVAPARPRHQPPPILTPLVDGLYSALDCGVEQSGSSSGS